MLKLLTLISMLVLLAAPAGAVLTDDEPSNDAVATAGIQMVSSGGVTTDGGAGFFLSFGDSDFIGITGLFAGDVIIVSTTPLEDPPFFEDPDTIVGLFDSATLDPTTQRLCIGDDAFNSDLDQFPTGFGSLCRLEVPTAGTYFVGITGLSSNEVPFDGTHFQAGNYEVTVTVVPEPGVLLQLASGVLGLAVLHARRRANG